MYFKLSRVSGFLNSFCCPISDQHCRPTPFTIIATLYGDAGVNWGEVCSRCSSLSAEQIQQMLYRKARLEACIAHDTAQFSREAIHKPDMTQEFQLYGGPSHE